MSNVITALAALANLSLADRYAVLKADYDAISKALDAVKAEIKATGLEVIEGERATVTVALHERKNFDSKAAKAFLTPEQIEDCTKVILVERITADPKVGVTVIA